MVIVIITRKKGWFLFMRRLNKSNIKITRPYAECIRDVTYIKAMVEDGEVSDVILHVDSELSSRGGWKYDPEAIEILKTIVDKSDYDRDREVEAIMNNPSTSLDSLLDEDDIFQRKD